MKTNPITHPLAVLLLAVVALLFPEVRPASGMEVNFRYMLSNFSGPVPSLWARLAVDPSRHEVFALHPQEREIRIFDEHGMEIFRFGDDIDLAGATDLTVDEAGNIYVLFPGSPAQTVLKLDYKGEPIGALHLQAVPAAPEGFRPNRLQYEDGRLYFADSLGFTLAVTDMQGRIEASYDLVAMLKALDGLEKEWREAEKRTGIELSGFSVDGRGNIYFTVPVLFAAFRLTPAGELQGFGRSGSGPGKFGVVAGIAADEEGRIFVADRLRCAVMVFDRTFAFLTEFGYRGDRPSNLIVPDDLALHNGDGAVYVAQAGNRGVSVFQVQAGAAPEMLGDLGTEAVASQREKGGLKTGRKVL